jgi:hypothetical protein
LVGIIKKIKKLKAFIQSNSVSNFLTPKTPKAPLLFSRRGWGWFFSRRGWGWILQKCPQPGGGGQKPLQGNTV